MARNSEPKQSTDFEGDPLARLLFGAVDNLASRANSLKDAIVDIFRPEPEVFRAGQEYNPSAQHNSSAIVENEHATPKQDFSVILPDGIKTITEVQLVVNYGAGTQGFFDQGHEFSAPVGGPAKVPAQEQSAGRPTAGSLV